MSDELVLTCTKTDSGLSCGWRPEHAIPDGETRVWPWLMGGVAEGVIGGEVPMEALTDLEGYVRRVFSVPVGVAKANEDYRALLREAAVAVFRNMGAVFQAELGEAMQ